MIIYLASILNENDFVDISNSNAYVLERNTINLLLFVDGATFNKSSSSSTWAFFCTICELPPLLRSSYQNIIRILFWNGKSPNFQAVFDHYLDDFKEVLRNGISINELNLIIKVKLHAFIADSQARPKVINSVQYNGINGCLHCLNPGHIYSKGKRIYHYDPSSCKRNNDIYKDDVRLAGEHNSPFEGIKGPSCLSEWIKIPEHVVLDYMHLCLEGFVKQITSIWMNSNNHKLQFYIGN